MTSKLSMPRAAVAVVMCLLGHAAPLRAQTVELMPFAGYRFGGDFFELVTGHEVDLDGAPALGLVLNVPLWNVFRSKRW
jgi:hypothetical protein